MATLIDSYSEDNQTNEWSIRSNSYTRIGQSFTGANGVLNSCKFYLKKLGTYTGNLTAQIYEHSGTYGTTSIFTGTALATSDNFDATTLDTSFSLVTFTFSGDNKISLTETKYEVVINGTGISGSANNNPKVGGETGNLGEPLVGHDGNACFEYEAETAYYEYVDLVFYVYIDSVTGRIAVTSRTNTENRSNTGLRTNVTSRTTI